jgi:pyruvate/2-oxoglutarate dehydrogenase complex dihydrolipoamide dehydrogenase (E3) component
MTTHDVDVLVLGAGPAGLVAAIRAADRGARTALVTRDGFGGMAALDGPVPVRTLAHAARLVRDAGQLERYGISVSAPALDYPRLLARVREVVGQVRDDAALRRQADGAGVAVHEHAGVARFVDAHTVETETGARFRAERIILCVGGASRRLDLPGFELTSTHSDAWALTAVPPTLMVIGGGATGAQVASIFAACGATVDLFQAAARLVPTEDEDVSKAVAAAFRERRIGVHEEFGTIASFEKTSGGVRMHYTTPSGERRHADAAVVVVAVGWVANTAGLEPARAGVELNARGFVAVNDMLRTSAEHVYAAGDVTGRMMLVPQAIQDGFVAATNATGGSVRVADAVVAPIGSFTDPEYAQVGLTEAKARESHDVLVTTVQFDHTVRTIIDGRTFGFCKLITDRTTHTVLGCHVVGDRAVDIVQTAAIVIATGMKVDDLARIPLSFPTYTGVLGRAAAIAARTLGREGADTRFADLL